MTKTYSNLLLLLFVLFGFPAFAQSQLLSGKITDGDSNTPLIGVSVLNEDNQGVYSDLDGNYKLNLTNGNHTITFAFIDYEKKKFMGNIDSGDQTLDV